MTEKIDGLILKGLGGLYTILPKMQEGLPCTLLRQDGTLECRARGALRYEKTSPMAGDRVRLKISGTDANIEAVLPRKNALIRPPVANVDLLFIVFSPCCPAPDLCYIDKLICICEHNCIEPVIIISKAAMAAGDAMQLYTMYLSCGFSVFCEDMDDAPSIAAIRHFMQQCCAGRISAFAGASGVG